MGSCACPTNEPTSSARRRFTSWALRGAAPPSDELAKTGILVSMGAARRATARGEMALEASSTRVGASTGAQPRSQTARTCTATVYVGSATHRYVRRMSGLMEREFPALRFADASTSAWNLICGPGPRLFHLQWIDVVLRRSTYLATLTHSARLVCLLILLRLRRVGIVWTVHNRVGKAHRRVLTDRILRSVVALLASRIVVLAEAARAEACAELPCRLARRAFWRKCSIVPMPFFGEAHGLPTDRQRAREALGINYLGPVLVYLVGYDQPDLHERLVDRDHRYRILCLDRMSYAKGLAEPRFGWRFAGKPDDDTFGKLISAGDAVVLTAERALSSMTLQAAAELRRPIIAVSCAATAELVQLGTAYTTTGIPRPDEIAELLSVAMRDEGWTDETVRAYADAHSDKNVAARLANVYRNAGLPI